MKHEPTWWAAFFLALERTDCNITASAELVGKTRQVVQYHRRKRPAFNARIEEVRSILEAREVRKVLSRLNAA